MSGPAGSRDHPPRGIRTQANDPIKRKTRPHERAPGISRFSVDNDLHGCRSYAPNSVNECIGDNAFIEKVTNQSFAMDHLSEKRAFRPDQLDFRHSPTSLHSIRRQGALGDVSLVDASRLRGMSLVKTDSKSYFRAATSSAY
jgi:hypothetical protein